MLNQQHNAVICNSSTDGYNSLLKITDVVESVWEGTWLKSKHWGTFFFTDEKKNSLLCVQCYQIHYDKNFVGAGNDLQNQML